MFVVLREVVRSKLHVMRVVCSPSHPEQDTGVEVNHIGCDILYKIVYFA